MIKLVTRWSKRRDKAKERLEICEKCEQYNHKTTQCQECWCFMEAKTMWPNAECPLNKWGPYKEDEKWMK